MNLDLLRLKLQQLGRRIRTNDVECGFETEAGELRENLPCKPEYAVDVRRVQEESNEDEAGALREG